MNNLFKLIITASLVSACASGSAVRTSQNTAFITATVDPSCGSEGAAAAAEQQAAIETIRSGFDRYIITGGESQNNVQVTQTIGSARTYGTYNRNGYTTNTTFTPRTIVSGNHEQTFSIVMFNSTDGDASNAIDARTVLGANWEKIAKNGALKCSR